MAGALHPGPGRLYHIKTKKRIRAMQRRGRVCDDSYRVEQGLRRRLGKTLFYGGFKERSSLVLRKGKATE
jgi:hypothetical protein